ncbi:MAG TPA: hypothetical protein VNA30_06940, partial [Mycobacteriales bacterium]|nr:hypothetical protein [Mycobacteriales bacterium]
MRAPTRLEQLRSEAERRAEAVFADPEFQGGLATLTTSDEETSRRFAADAVTLAVLATQVPRCPGDESGAGPWTSFLLEVAVARRCSDTYATHAVVLATTLVAHFPRTLALLATGAMPVYHARTLV